jgi:hypothetical protein
VQQFAWLVERSTSQERMAIWADDLRFNTLCLALKELLEGKTRSNIPEELKQQLSVIKKKACHPPNPNPINPNPIKSMRKSSKNGVISLTTGLQITSNKTREE